jgi:hypothetical protein
MIEDLLHYAVEERQWLSFKKEGSAATHLSQDSQGIAGIKHLFATWPERGEDRSINNKILLVSYLPPSPQEATGFK